MSTQRSRGGGSHIQKRTPKLVHTKLEKSNGLDVKDCISKYKCELIQKILYPYKEKRTSIMTERLLNIDYQGKYRKLIQQIKTKNFDMYIMW